MDDAQRAYCKQLRPLVDRQLDFLRKLAASPDSWFQLKDLGGKDKRNGHPDLGKTAEQLLEKVLIENRNERPETTRPLYGYRITPMGLAYLEYITPAAAPKNPNVLTEEDFAYIEVLPRDMQVLRILAGLPRGQWQKTKAVGGTNRSHHNICIRRLAEKKLIDRVEWSSLVTPHYRCRINDNGLRYLQYLDRKEQLYG